MKNNELAISDELCDIANKKKSPFNQCTLPNINQ
jgi:hypothetical protein